MILELTTEIEFLQPRCIKSGEEHVVDDENVHGHVLLEVGDDGLARLLIFLVMENKLCTKSVAGCYAELRLHFVD